MTSHYITSPACSNSFLHFLQHHNEDFDEDNDDDDDGDDDDYALVCKRQKQEQAVICRAASHKAPELVFKLSYRNQIINIINNINILNTINTTKHRKNAVSGEVTS